MDWQKQENKDEPSYYVDSSTGYRLNEIQITNVYVYSLLKFSSFNLASHISLPASPTNNQPTQIV